jgi:hypothetical protein
MARQIILELAFDFYPESDDQELFDGVEPEEQINFALDLACYDLLELARKNLLQDYLKVVTIGEPD